MPHSFVIVEADRLRAGMIRVAVHQAFPNAQITVARGLAEADAILAHANVDLLIIGTEGHDGDVIDHLFKWLGAPKSTARVLVVVGRRDERTLTALNALPLTGAFDPISEGHDELARAIQLVVAGGRYWSSNLMQVMMVHFSNAKSVSRRLTPTQIIIFAMIGAGHSDALIAQRLSLAETTVESTRRDLRGIFDVRRQCDLVQLAARSGYVSITPESVAIPSYANLLAARVGRRPAEQPRSGNTSAA